MSARSGCIAAALPVPARTGVSAPPGDSEHRGRTCSRKVSTQGIGNSPGKPEPRPPHDWRAGGGASQIGEEIGLRARTREGRPRAEGSGGVPRTQVPALEVRSVGLQVRVDLQESGQFWHVGQGGLQTRFGARSPCRRSRRRRHLRRSSPSSRGPRGSSGPSGVRAARAEPGEPRRAAGDLPFIAAEMARVSPGHARPQRGPPPTHGAGPWSPDQCWLVTGRRVSPFPLPSPSCLVVTSPQTPALISKFCFVFFS